MAKQIVNTGLADNDGTGDPLRNAFTKVNENFTELYNAESFSGSYADLSDKPSSITAFGITDGSNNQILSTDGAGNFTFINAGGSGGSGIGLTDLSIGTDGTPASDGSLAYDDTTGVFTFTPPVIPTTLLDLSIADGSNNQILSTNGQGAFAFVDAPSGGDGGSSLQTRINKVGVSASLTDGASGNVDIVGFKGYGLLSITTDKAAWVRIYANGASRTSDSSRSEVTDPSPDAGVIAEVITTGAETVLMSPSSMGFNMEATPTTNIPCAVTNKSGSTGTVSVTLNVLQLEA